MYFRIKPHPWTKFYFTVHVIPACELKAHAKALGHGRDGGNIPAMFEGAINKHLGKIWLSCEELCVDYVAHECLHATLHFLRCFGLEGCSTKFDRNREEFLAHSQQYMFAHIVNRLMKMGMQMSSNKDVVAQFFWGQTLYGFIDLKSKKKKKKKA